MHITSVALISVRIMGLFLMSQGILALPNLYMLGQISETDDFDFLPLMYVMFSGAILAPLLLGLIVVLFSRYIARWVCPSNVELIEEKTPSLSEVQSLAFSVLGLLIVFTSLPDLVSAWVSIYQSNANPVTDPPIGYFSTTVFISPFLALVFGFLLFVGARFWVRLYVAFRQFGLNKK